MAQKKLLPLPDSLKDLPERFPTTRKYLVAVSGGRDSVALLDLLHELGYRKLVIVHLNHKLRGLESTGDARFVKALGKRLGISVVAASEDVAKLAKLENCSVEAAARIARHRFFFEAASKHRCRRIFLGHHADDQAETVLMHLCRGSGARGLRGMKESTLLERDSNKKPLELIRPILGIRRDEIDAYASQRGIFYREDASNASNEYVRNRVRNVLMPQLCETFGRDVAPILNRLASILSDEDTLLEELAIEALSKAETGNRRLTVRALKALPITLQRRVLQHWLENLSLSGIGFSEIESIRSLLSQRDPAKVNLPRGRHARRRSGQLFIE